ncbi:nuclear transport factor 2 family protein (plasmid) [Rhizobium sp. CB3090]|uniref:nuclear transport factor 2 family protein n=1 Tax=Rhizobium sp. CB3090 TaxID=3039156 RepID=UPI0024B12B70|nr:nuclear transport factor 2 family protein [Rhizobium sp. CB3090]WFU11998.1 nuclear transport factor 2 family protein [Rhizobium sp. CB3090]
MAAVTGDFANRILCMKLALGMAVVIISAGPAIAQSAPSDPASNMPDCTYQGTDYLLSVTNPPPDDRQLIMDLIHRYNWALDDGSLVGVDEMLRDDVTYELCNSIEKQVVLKTNKLQLEQYLEDLSNELDKNRSMTRHIESNTLLNAVDANTVQGKTTVVVTIQFGGIETPVVDYTGALHTVFKKDGSGWKFSSIILITDGPKISFRAR